MKRFLLAFTATLALVLPAQAGGPGARVTGGAPYLDSLFLGLPTYESTHFFHPPMLDMCSQIGTTGTGDWVQPATGAMAVRTSGWLGNNHPCTMTYSNFNPTGASKTSLTPDGLTVGGGRMMFSTAIYFTKLSDGTDTYVLRAGFHNGTSGAPTSGGVFVSYTSAVDSGKFECSVSDAGSVTNTTTGITVATGTWYSIIVDITSTASGAGAASCTINGTSTAVSGATLPDDGEGTGASVQMVDSAGTNATAAFDVDYMDVMIGPFTTPRTGSN